MEYKKSGNYYILRIDKGEEIIESITKICKDEEIALGSIQAIGAVDYAKFGLFESKKKQYHSVEVVGDHEILSLNGNISRMNGEVYLHIHICLGDKNFEAKGGHLNKAIVSATCEVIINKIDDCVEREFFDEIGLNLFKFNG